MNLKIIHRDRSPSMSDKFLQRLARLPESHFAFPIVMVFSAFLMGMLFVIRMNADLNYDGEIYISAAMKFAKGEYREGLTVYPMPLYPLMILWVHKLIQNWVLAGKVISIFCMVVTIIPLFLLTRDLFNGRAAFWCCLVFAMTPEILILTNSVLRDPPFVLSSVFSVYFAQRTLKTLNIMNLIYSAFCVWLSTLFRVEGMIIFPLCLCVFLGLGIMKPNQRRFCFKVATVWGLTWALPAAVFFNSLSILGHDGINRINEWDFYYQGFKDSSLLESYNRISEQLLKIWETSPYRGVGQHITDVTRAMLPFIYLIGVIQMLLSIILFSVWIPLLFGIICTDYSENHLLVLALVAAFMALAYVFFIRTEIILNRYLILPSVLLMAWIGFGIEKIIAAVRGKAFSRLLLGTIIIALFALPIAKFNHLFMHSDNLASRVAAWIDGQNILQTSRIVFNDQIVKFYTEMYDVNGCDKTLLHVVPNDNNFYELSRFARDNSANVIVIKQNQKGGIRPYMPGYEMIYNITLRNKIVMIYTWTNNNT
jgi:hypothetical protein